MRHTGRGGEKACPNTARLPARPPARPPARLPHEPQLTCPGSQGIAALTCTCPGRRCRPLNRTACCAVPRAPCSQSCPSCPSAPPPAQRQARRCCPSRRAVPGCLCCRLPDPRQQQGLPGPWTASSCCREGRSVGGGRGSVGVSRAAAAAAARGRIRAGGSRSLAARSTTTPTTAQLTSGPRCACPRLQPAWRAQNPPAWRPPAPRQRTTA